MRRRLFRGLGWGALAVLSLSMACVDKIGGDTGVAPLYVYDGASNSVLVWDDINDLYDDATAGKTIPGPNRTITLSTAAPSLQLAWGGMAVLNGLVAGNTNKIIAYELGISPRTVEIYRANVMTKMKSGSLSELVRMALHAGVLGAEARARQGRQGVPLDGSPRRRRPGRRRPAGNLPSLAGRLRVTLRHLSPAGSPRRHPQSILSVAAGPCRPRADRALAAPGRRGRLAGLRLLEGLRPQPKTTAILRCHSS